MTTPARAQRGAALVVAMVMIFMLSIMGISAMRSSTLEKRMTINAIQSSTTLQAAESVTERLFNDKAVLNSAALQPGTIISVETEAVRDDIAFEQTAEVVFLGGKGPMFGFSPEFSALRFIAQGDVRIESARSRAIVRQGAAQLAPGQ